MDHCSTSCLSYILECSKGVVHLINSAADNVDEVIHTVDIANIVSSTINQMHNTFGTFQDGLATKYYMTNASAYTSDPVNTTNTLVNQEYYYLDAGSSNLISSNTLGENLRR